MNNTRVMILEDDPRASYTLAATVNYHQYFTVVSICESGAEALEQYPVHQPELVFVDITLTDGSGLKVMQQLREQGFHGHFIMTTAMRETMVIEQAIQLGAIDYLVKPIRITRVTQALDSYRQYRRVLFGQKTLNQEGIDRLFSRPVPATIRHTPKGIDTTTLKLLKHALTQLDKPTFSAEDVGRLMNFSRVTARRYLEYLESEGVLSLVLNFNTGGRPKRIYKMGK